MSFTTSGVAPRRGSQALRDAVELLSSMRFAISLLTLSCIASVIGTVVRQHEPYGNCVNQFGPFWAGVLGHAGLYTVYRTWWYLLILAFLVTSTSLCIARNTRRSWPSCAASRSRSASSRRGPSTTGPRAGSPPRQRPRWRASASVPICLGGLFDGDLTVRAQMALLGKTPFSGGGLIADVPAEHRLSAGNDAATRNAGEPLAPDGPQALAQFVENSLPEADRQRISEVLLRILNGCLFQLAQIAQERAGLAPLQPDEATQRFMTQAVLSLSDAAFYPAPVLLQLSGFTQVQASVFLVTRSPGKTLVYAGAVLLIIGVFAMLYIRERRLWRSVQPGEGGGTKLQAALSTTRRTHDVDAEFDQLKTALLAVPAAGATGPAA